jgi:CRISPR-associated protein Cas2
MPVERVALSRYQGMWLFAMFDLPVTTRKARREYAQFRKILLENGFSMLQFSVYARYCASEEFATAFRGRIRAAIPPNGYVRVLGVTDCQFGKMESYIGKKRKILEEAPSQLALF